MSTINGRPQSNFPGEALGVTAGRDVGETDFIGESGDQFVSTGGKFGGD
ncbi:MAG: hypothetical protein HY360_13550, partial [Verrucomicrobia bacterium]|nr:hypothetical protein [Verrucomicrobiota bacterium]